MLPTPSTSHVSFDTIYEPSEDSYLFLDTLSTPTESSWLKQRFSNPSIIPLIVEVGTGSGVVLAFITGNSMDILGRKDIFALGIDVNHNACLATKDTVENEIFERQCQYREGEDEDIKSLYLSSITSDLCRSIRPGCVDILLFNPPYVPTEDLPNLPSSSPPQPQSLSKSATFEHNSYLLELSYAGGEDGMEVTNRLLAAVPDLLHPVHGVAYVLLCKQNRPEEVKERIRGWGSGWMAETVGSSGMRAGWEKLVILRIWRDGS